MKHCKVAHCVTTTMSESMNVVDQRTYYTEKQEIFYLCSLHCEKAFVDKKCTV